MQKGQGDGVGVQEEVGVREVIPGVSGTAMKGCGAMTHYPQEEPPAPPSHPITFFPGALQPLLKPQREPQSPRHSRRWKSAPWGL